MGKSQKGDYEWACFELTNFFISTHKKHASRSYLYKHSKTVKLRQLYKLNNKETNVITFISRGKCTTPRLINEKELWEALVAEFPENDINIIEPEIYTPFRFVDEINLSRAIISPFGSAVYPILFLTTIPTMFISSTMDYRNLFKGNYDDFQGISQYSYCCRSGSFEGNSCDQDFNSAFRAKSSKVVECMRRLLLIHR